MDEPVFIESRDKMEQILREEEVGYLGVADEGQPYVVPLNYAYAAGKILFHCAFTGQKLDAIRRNPQVCFTVGRQTGTVMDHTGAPLISGSRPLSRRLGVDLLNFRNFLSYFCGQQI